MLTKVLSCNLNYFNLSARTQLTLLGWSVSTLTRAASYHWSDNCIIRLLIKSVCYQNQRYFPETQNKRTNKEEMIKISYIWIKITDARLEFSVKLRITSDLSLLQ